MSVKHDVDDDDYVVLFFSGSECEYIFVVIYLKMHSHTIELIGVFNFNVYRYGIPFASVPLKN